MVLHQNPPNISIIPFFRIFPFLHMFFPQGRSSGEYSEVLLHGLILGGSVERYPRGDFDGLDARAAWQLGGSSFSFASGKSGRIHVKSSLGTFQYQGSNNYILYSGY